MKKEYVDLSVEIAMLEVTDVICTSSPFDGEDQYFGNQGKKFKVF